MLNLFQSNQMANLAEAFCERSADQGDPFEPLTVVVQSLGLGQWLKMQLAARHGIAANVDAVLPATFLWRLYRALIPETANLELSPFDSDRLVWRIMRLLKTHPELSPAIQNYVNSPGDQDLRYFQLSTEIALLFDEYLMYRPEWMLAWAGSGTHPGTSLPHQDWQAELWRLIVSDVENFSHLHRAALHQTALTRLTANDFSSDATGIWQRISIFGLSTMPELQLQTFEALAEHTDVDIYFLNPCEQYWGDIVSERAVAQRSIRSLIQGKSSSEALIDEDYLEVGNPLLSSLGKQAREYLELLLGSNRIQSHEGFARNPGRTALDLVKNDILDMTFAGEFAAGKAGRARDLEDHSIQIHSCHSRLREVEVLHDEILRTLGESPNLELSEILVMVPNISDYAPFIGSVFGQNLNHRITDLGNLENSIILDTFLTLLKLPESRFTGPEIMDLLEVPAVMRRLEFSAADLETIAYWIGETGIRWEVSGTHKAELWDLPDQNQNTFQFGMDRLMLGFAMSPEAGIWQSVLPFEMTTTESELFHRFKVFIDKLTALRERLRAEHTWRAWEDIIAEMLGELLQPIETEQLDVDLVLRLASEFSENANYSNYDAPVSRMLVTEAFNRALTRDESRAGFINGGITFATLVPMRSIPFRMICLMGMNDGEYPREKRPHSFDLIAADKPRRGDRSKRLDDRYLFLESLLSAQDYFYVSYIGRGVRDDKPRPASVVVAEWHNYLSQLLIKVPFQQHPLQPFNPRYYQGDASQSFNRVWYQALVKEHEPHKFSNQPLISDGDDTSEIIELSDLAAFLRHSGRYFLQQQLGVYFEDGEIELKDAESFEPDALERYQLADAALGELIAGHDLTEFTEAVTGSGQLMPGLLGQQHLGRELARARNLYSAFTELTTTSAFAVDEVVELASGDLRVSLPALYLNDDEIEHNDVPHRFINVRAGAVNSRQLLNDWVFHLGINAAGYANQTVSLGKGTGDKIKQITLMPIAQSLAQTHLARLVTCYRQGRAEPLLMPPDAGRRYTEARVKGMDHHDAVAKTLQAWQSDQAGSEGQDRVWARLFDLPADFDGAFSELAPAIWMPLLEHVDG